MTEPDLIRRLKEIPLGDDAKLAALAATLLAESRENGRIAVALWKRADGDVSEKARSVIPELSEQAVLPLLDAAPMPDRRETAWLLRRAVDQFIAVRSAVRDRLVKLLDDKILIPLPPRRGRSEVEPPPVRICDEAYLQLSRLLNVNESAEQATVNADLFLSQLDFQQRDMQILKWRKSKQFRNFVEEGVE